MFVYSSHSHNWLFETFISDLSLEIILPLLRCSVWQVLVLVLIVSHLLLNGDVQQNPGIVKFPCLVCKQQVAKTHYAIQCDQCDQCDQWAHHYKCEGLTRKQYLKLENDRLTTWFCSKCKLPNVITETSTLHLDTSNFYWPLSDMTTGSQVLSDGYPKVNNNQQTTSTTNMTVIDGTLRPTTRKEHKTKNNDCKLL